MPSTHCWWPHSLTRSRVENAACNQMPQGPTFQLYKEPSGFLEPQSKAGALPHPSPLASPLGAVTPASAPIVLRKGQPQAWTWQKKWGAHSPHAAAAQCPGGHRPYSLAYGDVLRAGTQGSAEKTQKKVAQPQVEAAPQRPERKLTTQGL